MKLYHGASNALREPIPSPAQVKIKIVERYIERAIRNYGTVPDFLHVGCIGTVMITCAARMTMKVLRSSDCPVL